MRSQISFSAHYFRDSSVILEGRTFRVLKSTRHPGVGRMLRFVDSWTACHFSAIGCVMDPELTRLSSVQVYGGRTLKVAVDTVRLPNGRVIDLEMIRHPGASAVVPVHADGTVTLIRQVRYAAGGWLLEIPAGKLDPEETPAACAARELAEEAGLIAGRMIPLGAIFTTPGFTDERIWLFLALDLAATVARPEYDEQLVPERMPLAEAAAMALNGNITDAKTVCALMRAWPHCKDLRTSHTGHDPLQGLLAGHVPAATEEPPPK